MGTVAIALARMGSTRVPGKVMRDLYGDPVLYWTIRSLRYTRNVDEIVLATSTDKRDDDIEDFCKWNNINCFRGSEDDVLDRFYRCARAYNADVVVRVTCDCPFLDPQVTAEVIRLRQATGADYASNCYPPTYPDGLDVDVMTFEALEASWKESTSRIDRDCMTQFIVRNRNRFKIENLVCPLPGLIKERWVLDTEDDWQFCNKLTEKYGRHIPPPSYVQILNILDQHPEIRECNKDGIRNERFYDALSREELPPRTFEQSERVFKRAIQTIPLGAQTYSKSHLQLPKGHYPLYASHGEGGYIFDVDGNRYVDLIGGLLPVVLGHCDPDVDGAIRRQLDKGINLSLATELEAELAEILCHHIPCAEMVKLGKTGTDVTTAAVRLARAHTGRDRILTSGYHGWADWSMSCTDRHSGIPEDIRNLSTNFNWGSRFIFRDFVKDTPAAIIVEPTSDSEYLSWLREVCDDNKIVLIFDEIITGFRYDLGGAQKLYGVTPDLACFGKAMANGMPISALVGKREIMSKMNSPDVFYSGTMFGETLSIAAAIATIKKIEREGVIDHLTTIGVELDKHIRGLILEFELTGHVMLTGWYTNQKIEFKDHPNISADKMRAVFMRVMAKYGVLIINCNGLMYAHRKPEIERIKTAYIHTLGRIGFMLNEKKLSKDVVGVPASPLRKTA